MAIKKPIGERIFQGFNVALMLVIVVVTMYPLLHVAFASISDPVRIMQHTGVLLKPLGFSLAAYKAVFENPNIWMGYANTVFYVVVGTAVNLVMTTLGAYVLSRRHLMLKNAMMMIIVFTMFFSGGLIPTFLTVKMLGMYNSRLALIIPGAISTYNLIIMRTFFASQPYELEEAAKIDGAGEIKVLIRIILPLSMPIIAVMTLFYGVSHWNSWFSAMVYLRNNAYYPLQLILRDILISNSTSDMMTNAAAGSDKEMISETIKYATIMVATVPILMVYPFLQKYFVKGVMIGAIKG